MGGRIGAVSEKIEEAVVAGKKVVYVDFRKRRKPAGGGFGGTVRQLFVVFLAASAAVLLLAAAFYPQSIASGFFAPTVIAVGVAATLGARRLAAHYQISRMHRDTLRKSAAFRDKDDHSGRTLH